MWGVVYMGEPTHEIIPLLKPDVSALPDRHIIGLPLLGRTYGLNVAKGYLDINFPALVQKDLSAPHEIRIVNYSVNISSLANKLGISFIQVLWHKVWGTLNVLIENKIATIVHEQIRNELASVTAQNNPEKLAALLRELSNFPRGIREQYQIMKVVNQFVEGHRDSLSTQWDKKKFDELLINSATIIGEDFAHTFERVKDDPIKVLKLLQQVDALPWEVRKNSGIVELLRETAKGWNKEKTEAFNAAFIRQPSTSRGGVCQTFGNIISARRTLFEIQKWLEKYHASDNTLSLLDHVSQRSIYKLGPEVSKIIGGEIVSRLKSGAAGSVFEYLEELERAAPVQVKSGIRAVLESKNISNIEQHLLPEYLKALKKIKEAQSNARSTYNTFETTFLSNLGKSYR